MGSGLQTSRTLSERQAKVASLELVRQHCGRVCLWWLRTKCSRTPSGAGGAGVAGTGVFIAAFLGAVSEVVAVDIRPVPSKAKRIRFKGAFSRAYSVCSLNKT